MTTNLIGETIGTYRLDKVIGRGGMATVYRARQLNIERDVAVKVMAAELATDSQFFARFKQEADLIAALAHPHVLPIYDYGQFREHVYLVVRLMEGSSLDHYIKNNPLSLPDIEKLVIQIADGLHQAHQRSIVHRDLKPNNMLLDKAGNCYLADFGIAKTIKGTQMTKTGTMIGSPAYMAPEQWKGESIDQRTDIYSLGIVLYELLTGDVPFYADTPHQYMYAHLDKPMPRASLSVSGFPSIVDDVILKATAKNPQDRYQNVIDLKVSFLDALRSQAITPPSFSVTALKDRLESPYSGAPTRITETVLDSQLNEPTVRDLAPNETQHVSKSSQPQGIDAAIPEFSNRTNNEIVVVSQGTEPKRYPISKPTLIIGRENQDITLPSIQVSRLHARIEKQPNNAYTITDLGSANGTFLDRAKLLSNVPEKLTPGTVIAIGEYRLGLQLAESVVGPGPDPIPPGPPLPIGEDVTVRLVPQALQVEAGDRIDAHVEIANRSALTEHFYVRIQGIPVEWVSIDQKPLQLNPGDGGSLPITIHPPRHHSASAGAHNLRLIVSSEERNKQIAYAMGTLVVNPFHSFSTDFSPNQLRRNGLVQISVANEGNNADSYTISGRDKAEGLTFIPSSSSLAVGPGQSEGCEIEVRPRRSNFFGVSQTYPFEVNISSSNSQPQAKHGTLIHPPLVPVWMLGFLTVLCMICVGIGLFAYSEVTASNNDYKTETARAISDARNDQTAVQQTQSAEITSTFIAGENVATQTAFAGTETASAEQTQNALTQTAIAENNEATQSATSGSLTAAAVQTENAATPTPTFTFTPSDTPTPTFTLTPSATPIPTIPAILQADCLPYTASSLRIVDEGASGWLLTDGFSRMLILDNQTDAQQALAIAQRHTEHCFIGRSNTRSNRKDYIVQYWLGTSGLTTSVSGEDCLSYDKNNLRIVDEGSTGWLLTDGRSRMLILDNQSDAQQALVLAQIFSEQCFIGRSNTRSNRIDYIVEYWK